MNRQTAWNEIVRITHCMHGHASREEWEEVSAMEAGRQALLKAFFAQAPTLTDAEWIAKGIHEILELDKDIMTLGKDRLGIISQQLRNIHAGRKAGKEYRKYA